MPPPTLQTRTRLSEVRYEIRGELARRARELEAQGRTLIKLNIGNPGAFGFRAPEHLQRAIADHIARTDPYTHQQGLPEAREAIAAFHRQRGTPNASPERVFIGNGVSELIDISLRALLNPGDEVLLPSPDYPLWSAATILNDGRPVYYRCDEANGFLPDPEQIESLVSPRTRAIVLINPNNPTGANYPRALLERIVAIAAKHRLLLMADEIYDGILYDDHSFQPLAPLAGDLPCLSFGGLSKVHRACLPASAGTSTETASSVSGLMSLLASSFTSTLRALRSIGTKASPTARAGVMRSTAEPPACTCSDPRSWRSTGLPSSTKRRAPSSAQSSPS